MGGIRSNKFSRENIGARSEGVNARAVAFQGHRPAVRKYRSRRGQVQCGLYGKKLGAAVAGFPKASL
jgi:hypothetical protein